MYNNLVISVDELWLKGRNQHLYLKSAINHINSVLKNYHSTKFSQKILSQRILYCSTTPFSDETLEALKKVPGLSSISPCKIIRRSKDQDLENIYDEVLYPGISCRKNIRGNYLMQFRHCCMQNIQN